MSADAAFLILVGAILVMLGMLAAAVWNDNRRNR